MQEAEVFSAYETTIGLSTLEEQQEGYSLSTTSTITVDNTGNSREYPILTISSADSNITEIDIEGNTITLDENLSNTDLVIDLKNQIYTNDGANIIEGIVFSSNDRPHFLENSINTIDITFTNSIEVDLVYNSYEPFNEPKFVRDFRLSKDLSYITDRKYKEVDKEKLIKDTINYNISMSNLSYDWVLGDAINNDKTFRISYSEEHTNGDKSFEKNLVGVKFGTFERYFRDSTAILIDSLTGEGTKLY